MDFLLVWTEPTCPSACLSYVCVAFAKSRGAESSERPKRSEGQPRGRERLGFIRRVEKKLTRKEKITMMMSGGFGNSDGS